jgi:hypothetical protein
MFIASAVTAFGSVIFFNNIGASLLTRQMINQFAAIESHSLLDCSTVLICGSP